MSIILLFSLIWFLSTTISAQLPPQGNPCQYSHTFSNVGEFVQLRSEKYPDFYPLNTQCYYYIYSPKGTQIRLQCTYGEDFYIDCPNTLFGYSPGGRDDFADGVYYTCGGRSIDAKSNNQKLIVGFRSNNQRTPSSYPYRYNCRVSVVAIPCSCGVSGPSKKIVGGTEATPGEFPWRVALSYKTGNDYILFCAGALISNSWILTAAHCIVNIDKNTVIYADLGDYDLTNQNEMTPINQLIATDIRIQNSRYVESTQDSDTALLRLVTPAEFNANVQPLCLPWKFTAADFQGKVATISGWGSTKFGGRLSYEALMKASVDVINNPNCKKAWAGTSTTITDNMICAGRSGVDTCQADSGGTLDFQDPDSKQFYGIGIVSFGVSCGQPGNPPGVYAEVVKFLGWIEQNSGETFCKT